MPNLTSAAEPNATAAPRGLKDVGVAIDETVSPPVYHLERESSDRGLLGVSHRTNY